MSSRFSTLASAPVLLVLVACGARTGDGAPSATLGAGVAAVVGTERVDVETVQRIARAQGVTLEGARRRAISDALFAASANERLGTALSARARRGALARALLESLAAEAKRRGPPTDAELAAATERRWWELDRPPLLRTTHAVAVVKKPEDDKAARAVAERIAAATQSATTAEAFSTAAKSVAPDGVDVHVEDLEPVARDRRVVNPDSPPPPGSRTGEYAEAYVAAAFAIPHVGEKSPVVRTEFGYHVIFATKLYPEKRVPVEERRSMLEPEILVHRTTELRDAALARARTVDAVEVERSAGDLTEKVSVAP